MGKNTRVWKLTPLREKKVEPCINCYHKFTLSEYLVSKRRRSGTVYYCVPCAVFLFIIDVEDVPSNIR